MFFDFPAAAVADYRNLFLILNTVLLVVVLVVFELFYAETPKSKRRHLKFFWPLTGLLGLLTIWAIYLQGAAG